MFVYLSAVILDKGIGDLLVMLGTMFVAFVVMSYWLISRRKPRLFLFTFLGGAIITAFIKLFFTVDIVEISPGQEIIERVSIGFPVYKAIDGQEIKIRRSGTATLYINSSNINFLLVPVVYGTVHNDPRIAPIALHSHLFLNDDIDYNPNSVPPDEMRIKGGGITYYWLTTVEKYVRFDTTASPDFRDY